MSTKQNEIKFLLSPRYTDRDFPIPHDFATKVTLFHDRWRGWKFEVADKALNGYKRDELQIPPIPDSGYAAMDNIFSYFEPLGKYLAGYCDPGGNRQSGVHFKIGVRAVLPALDQHPDQADVDVLLGMLWGGVRCGIYHAGAPKGSIAITGSIPEPIRIATDDKVMFINPHVMLEAVTTHVDDYKKHLLAEGEASDVGTKFTARYDYDNPLPATP